MKVASIRQTVNLPGTPRQVYDASMTTKPHVAFTKTKARISPKVGGTFMAWGGHFTARISSSCRARPSTRPGSRATRSGRRAMNREFATRSLRTPRGTRVTFTHSRVPTEHVGHLSSGWKKSYWDPLRAYLSAK